MAAAGELLLRIPAMDCPAEEGEIRRALEPIPGIRRLSFDLAGRTLSVDAHPDAWSDIEAAVKQVGFDSERLAEAPDVDATTLSRNAFLQPMAALLVAIVS